MFKRMKDSLENSVTEFISMISSKEPETNDISPEAMIERHLNLMRQCISELSASIDQSIRVTYSSRIEKDLKSILDLISKEKFNMTIFLKKLMIVVDIVERFGIEDRPIGICLLLTRFLNKLLARIDWSKCSSCCCYYNSLNRICSACHDGITDTSACWMEQLSRWIFFALSFQIPKHYSSSLSEYYCKLVKEQLLLTRKLIQLPVRKSSSCDYKFLNEAIKASSFITRIHPTVNNAEMEPRIALSIVMRLSFSLYLEPHRLSDIIVDSRNKKLVTSSDLAWNNICLFLSMSPVFHISAPQLSGWRFTNLYWRSDQGATTPDFAKLLIRKGCLLIQRVKDAVLDESLSNDARWQNDDLLGSPPLRETLPDNEDMIASLIDNVVANVRRVNECLLACCYGEAIDSNLNAAEAKLPQALLSDSIIDEFEQMWIVQAIGDCLILAAKDMSLKKHICLVTVVFNIISKSLTELANKPINGISYEKKKKCLICTMVKHFFSDDGRSSNMCTSIMGIVFNSSRSMTLKIRWLKLTSFSLVVSKCQCASDNTVKESSIVTLSNENGFDRMPLLWDEKALAEYCTSNFIDLFEFLKHPSEREMTSSLFCMMSLPFRERVVQSHLELFTTELACAAEMIVTDYRQLSEKRLVLFDSIGRPTLLHLVHASENLIKYSSLFPKRSTIANSSECDIRSSFLTADPAMQEAISKYVTFFVHCVLMELSVALQLPDVKTVLTRIQLTLFGSDINEIELEQSDNSGFEGILSYLSKLWRTLIDACRVTLFDNKGVACPTIEAIWTISWSRIALHKHLPPIGGVPAYQIMYIESIVVLSVLILKVSAKIQAFISQNEFTRPEVQQAEFSSELEPDNTATMNQELQDEIDEQLIAMNKLMNDISADL